MTFKVVAGGTPPFTYQWFFNGNPLTNQISDTLTLTNVQTSQSGNYTVTVSNSAGSITSQPATLNVQEIGAPIVTIVSPTNGAKFPDKRECAFGGRGYPKQRCHHSGGIFSRHQSHRSGDDAAFSGGNAKP